MINRDDAHDLFISDLNGQNLTQVSQNMDINRYYFQNDHSEIFLFYRDRTNEREEHKRNKFAIYDIKTKTLRKPSDIDKALDDFEKVLRQ